MTAPALAVYVTGGPAVTGDNLNTFKQTCNTVAQLRGLVGVEGLQVYTRGTAAPNDGGQGNFYWNTTGTAADDNGLTTVVPFGAGSGEWTRLDGTTIVRSASGIVSGNAIIQVGVGMLTLSSGIASATITFPAPFPNACLAVVACDANLFSGLAINAIVYACENLSTTGFTLTAAAPASPTSNSPVAGRYIAIGY